MTRAWKATKPGGLTRASICKAEAQGFSSALEKWSRKDLILREIWVSKALYRLREAQRTLRDWGYQWREVQVGEYYWIFPQKEGGLTRKLVRLAPGIWAIYSEK